jgi:hypothetical protein
MAAADAAVDASRASIDVVWGCRIAFVVCRFAILLISIVIDASLHEHGID